ncbi:hypothetical protein CCHR01_04981 [Colletotrichum chrysophilum]|uniref:Uncharacterized protein n=1 Tax=Colletotrichum chrysophilum TaxID=1836956 RepID=A0AAD9EL32_9PEZI|nr:hypothetical protein CCHR01_04981 [Colletotrichum chrysophilum]
MLFEGTSPRHSHGRWHARRPGRLPPSCIRQSQEEGSPYHGTAGHQHRASSAPDDEQ